MSFGDYSLNFISTFLVNFGIIGKLDYDARFYQSQILLLDFSDRKSFDFVPV